MNFKSFLNELLNEGGAALKTSPITQVEARKHIPKIIKQVVATLGVNPINVKQLGSAGKKPNDDDVSGDIDLAVNAEATDVESALPKLAHDGKTFKVMKGINVYSYGYKIDDKVVQVDLMPVSNPSYAAWASQAHELDLKDGLKGAHRNELIFAIAKHSHAQVEKTGKDGQPLVIRRYFYDLHRGLMVGTQTREGTGKEKKSFKTVSKKVVSDDPIEVTKFLFGDSFTPDQVSSFKGALAAINSPKFAYKAKRHEIIEMAKAGMKSKKLSIPDYL